MQIDAFYEVLRSSWTVVAVLTFLAIVAWAFRPSNRAEFEKRARIPLDER
jgi:cbb3-type cytochrome oxidase subunit 3